MSKILKNLLICLAVIAVGVGQVVGVKSGFLCGCTGEKVQQSDCKTAACHSHLSQCAGSDVIGAEPTASGDCHNVPGQDGHQHKHRELREALVVTSFPPALALPPVTLFDLPAPYEVTDFVMLSKASCPVLERPDPPEYGSPPMPLLVAKTIVMLV